jgi:hypothetical protein
VHATFCKGALRVRNVFEAAELGVDRYAQASVGDPLGEGG